jgi:CelD/BcsL family acetyltransferase involved in cellulose biosynthesis
MARASSTPSGIRHASTCHASLRSDSARGCPVRVVEVKVEILGGRDARTFLAAPDRWLHLLRHDALATPYQSPAWLTTHARHLPPLATPLVLAVENAKRTPVAALALVREQQHDGTSRIFALGSPRAEYVRPVGPASEDADAAGALVRTLHRFAQQGEAVRIADVPRGSALGRQLSLQPGWTNSMSSCASVPLPVPYQRLSRDNRRAHQRREQVWKDLLEEGREVTYSRCVGTERLPAWDALVGLHQARWSGARPEGERELLDVLASPGAFVAQLRLDGVAVAANLCLTRGPHCYSLLPAMNPDLLDYAPGHALLRHLTSDLTRAGLVSLNLGRTLNQRGQRQYKAQYAPLWAATVTAASTHVKAATSARSLNLGAAA